MQLLINSSGAALTVRNGCFVITNETTSRMVSPLRITSIAIVNNCNVSSQAILLAAEQAVPLFVINKTGAIKAQFWSVSLSNHTAIRRQQVLTSDLPETTAVILKWLTLKCKNQLNNLLLLKYKNDTSGSVQDCTEAFNQAILQLQTYKDFTIANCANNLMGIEGAVSRTYFKTVSSCLPPAYQFEGRSRMPANDMFNAMLNYLYGMLYSITENALLTAGLDPCFGILHGDGYDTPALSFDFIEPFRPWADELLIVMCNQHIPLGEWFIIKDGAYRLAPSGKKILIPAFNQFLHTRIKFDKKMTTRYNLIYRMAQHFAARLLERYQNLKL